MMTRLAFLLALVLTSCHKSPDNESILATEENGQVTGLSISTRLLSSADGAGVFLKGASDPVLGSFERRDDRLIFTAAVHLSRGQAYELRRGREILGSIELATDESSAVPELLAVYPSGDSIAENTLKMYFRFSEPMMEGVSAKHVYVLRDGRDTMNGTFLDLQPELWNEDGTVLTLWLDPGRIKRDLIPNQTLGNPLTAGVNYTIVVTSGWKSKAAKATLDVFRKSYFTIGRDNKSPQPGSWSLAVPKSGSRDALTITFGEPLDYMLILHAIHLTAANGDVVGGTLHPMAGESGVEFIPVRDWLEGKYMIEVEGRLEDTAGNNLSRLFDREITTDTHDELSNPVVIHFEVP